MTIGHNIEKDTIVFNLNDGFLTFLRFSEVDKGIAICVDELGKMHRYHRKKLTEVI